MSISKIIVTALKKYSYILQKDFTELSNVVPKKRKTFISSGIKIFMKNVEAEIRNFNLELDFFIDIDKVLQILDMVISIEVKKDNVLCEYIVFNPIKMHFFYSFMKDIFFNDRKINSLVDNDNGITITSKDNLFMHNIYLCYLLLGTYKEVIIYKEHMEMNKFAINIINKVIKEEVIENGVRYC